MTAGDRRDAAGEPVSCCAPGSGSASAAASAGARADARGGGGIRVDPVLGSRATSLVQPHRPLRRARAEGRRRAAGRAIARRATPRPAGRPLPSARGGARAARDARPAQIRFHCRGAAGAQFVAITRHARVEPHGVSPRRAAARTAAPVPTSCRTPHRSAPCRCRPPAMPILLMADRQTTGGYPKIATVITADLPLAGQLAPGDWIEFEPCSRAAPSRRCGARTAALAGKRRVTDFGAVAAMTRLGRPRCAGRAARAVDDLQGRRPGRLAADRPFCRRGTAALPAWRERTACPLTVLGGGSNVLMPTRACAGSCSASTAATCVHGERRPCAPTPASRSTASCAGRSPRRRRARSVGRHARHGRRRDLRQRALPGTADLGADRSASTVLTPRRGSSAGRHADGDGVRLRLQPPAPHPRDRAVGGLQRRAGETAALRAVARESLAFRKRTQPLEKASAGCIFQNPDPARDRLPDGDSLVGRGAGRSRRAQGRQARAAPACHRATRTSSSTTVARRAADIARLIDALPARRCASGSASSCGTRSSGSDSTGERPMAILEG